MYFGSFNFIDTCYHPRKDILIMYMSEWAGPSKCDRWEIRVEEDMSIWHRILKRPRYRAYANGYREDSHHHVDIGSTILTCDRAFYGSTIEEAENNIRNISASK